MRRQGRVRPTTAQVINIQHFNNAATLTRSRTLVQSFAVAVLASVLITTPARGADNADIAGINLARIADWSTDLSFVDLFKRSRPWYMSPWGNVVPDAPPVKIDDRGWPTSLEPGEIATTVLKAPGIDFAANTLRCEWDGKGELTFSGGAKGGSSKSSPMDVTLSDQRKGMLAHIKATDAADPMRNLRCYSPANDPAALFDSAFVERWKPFRTIRYMDWSRTNDSQLVSWSERSLMTDMTWAKKGIPVEVIGALSNLTASDPWITVPHLADDDYIEQMARMLKDEVDPNLTIYVEYSNEVWNSIFAQAKHAETRARSRKPGLNELAARATHYAQRSDNVFKIFNDVFGADSKRLVRVLSGHSANPHFLKLVLAQDSLHKRADAIAIAPYMSMNVSRHGKPLESTVQNWSLDDVFAYLRDASLPATVSEMRKNKALADKYGLRLLAYEAGQHLVGIGQTVQNQRINDLLMSANRDSRMGDIYKQYLDAWSKISGDVIMLYSSMRQHDQWGSWGLSEAPHHPIDKSPKLKAVLEWMNR